MRFLILFLLAQPGQAAVIEYLSGPLLSVHCDDIEEAEADRLLAELENRKSIPERLGKKNTDELENRYLRLLVDDYSQDLSCVSREIKKFSAKLESREKSEEETMLDVLVSKFKNLRITRTQLTEASEKIANDPNVMTKLCPQTGEELEKSIYSRNHETHPGLKTSYEACKALLAARASHKLGRAITPLVDHPLAEAFLKNYYQLNDNALGAFHEQMHAKVLALYQSIAEALRTRGTEMQNEIQKPKPDINTPLKRYLVGDKVRNDKLLGTHIGLQPLRCHMENLYGQPVENLENTLFVSSFLASGVGSVLFKTGRGIYATRFVSPVPYSRRLITISIPRMLQVTSLASYASAKINELMVACREKQPYQPKLSEPNSSKQCQMPSMIESLEIESCWLEGLKMTTGLASDLIMPVVSTKTQQVLLGATRSKYKTKAMSTAFKGENTTPWHPAFRVWQPLPVRYFTAAERQKYLVFVNSRGLLVDSKGKLLNVDRAPYVMDRLGNIYVMPIDMAGRYNHSSLLAGNPVAAAGEIWIKNGFVNRINRKSGHYSTAVMHLTQFINELKKRFTNLSQAVVPGRTINSLKGKSAKKSRKKTKD